MNKNFKILWFEDNNDWLKPIKQNIDDYLKNKYLVPQLKIFDSANKFDIKQLLKEDFDLILVDNKLLDSPNGSEVIRQVRNNAILTDILFYSSNLEELKDFVIKNLSEDINGIYIVQRDAEKFIEKVEQMIDKNIRRSESIINFRGIVMDSASEFETLIQEKLSELCDLCNEEQKSTLRNIIQRSIINHTIKDYCKVSDKILNDFNEIKKINEAKIGFSMSNRLTILRDFAEATNTDLTFNSQNINDYYSNLFGIFRNSLGHAEVGSTITVGKKQYSINEDFFQLIRRNISDLNTNLSNGLEHFLDTFRTESEQIDN